MGWGGEQGGVWIAAEWVLIGGSGFPNFAGEHRREPTLRGAFVIRVSRCIAGSDDGAAICFVVFG